MQYNFEWDLKKAKQNLRKHKVSFERAAEIFLDPLAISIYDEDHSTDEDRWITMGKDRAGIVLVVIHTFCEQINDQCAVRMISARKATRNEIKQYEGDML
ncbi:MAG: BrnT family toxin [Proteobacteria bacterium]|nr:BrnT family toxin [Pseudomonadota bacterium]